MYSKISYIKISPYDDFPESENDDTGLDLTLLLIIFGVAIGVSVLVCVVVYLVRRSRTRVQPFTTVFVPPYHIKEIYSCKLP